MKEKQKTKQTKKTEKNKGRAEALVKGWELNDFVVHLKFSPINM